MTPSPHPSPRWCASLSLSLAAVRSFWTRSLHPRRLLSTRPKSPSFPNLSPTFSSPRSAPWLSSSWHWPPSLCTRPSASVSSRRSSRRLRRETIRSGRTRAGEAKRPLLSLRLLLRIPRLTYLAVLVSPFSLSVSILNHTLTSVTTLSLSLSCRPFAHSGASLREGRPRVSSSFRQRGLIGPGVRHALSSGHPNQYLQLHVL